MPCRRYYLLIGLLFCWLFAGVNGATVLAAQGNASGEPGNELNRSTSIADDGKAVLSGNRGVQQLEQSAEALYGYVLEGNVVKVREETAEISRIFVSSSFEGLTSVEGINALSAVIIDLKAAVAAVQISPQRWEAAAAKLRLAANSLNHPRQPMWLQYYKPIREDLNALEQSASVNDLAGWKATLERLQSRYDNIRPAVIISRQPEVVNAFDSWLSYAAGVPTSSQKIERARLIEIVSYGQEAVRVMFDKEKDEPALSLPMAPQNYGIWGLLAAGFIIAALGYAGYRKYRGTNQEWKIV
ncbi:sporulation protein YpjB [Paenibacillus monticola]|uniref:Sporulation protein n=1 Tax=Paenibacillus monticola TaxID=2666075 RepID=A0A7X2H4G9_9BACL|nr:sporulation protein YpjB [Paenibacillus monticola]MRN53359.1 sporulation protein [Paenibacillus monticola]